MPTVDPLSQEIARIGRDLYERQIRPQVETEANIGRLVSIDIHTGDYEVGDNLLETVSDCKPAVLTRRFGTVVGLQARRVEAGSQRSGGAGHCRRPNL